MTDLNEWNLKYPSVITGAVDYDFGILAEDTPLSIQVDVGDPDRSVVDQQHGLDNAVLMGRDLLGGRDLVFTLTTVPDPTSGTPSQDAMDLVSAFGAKWRAPGTSRTPGSYATLTNRLRNRYVLGRPRQFSPKYARARKGIVEYLAAFHTITPDFYDATADTVHPVRTVNLNADIGGDLPAWPFITLTGRFDTATLAWVPPVGFSGWSITVSHVTATNIPVFVDTRPWSRGTRDLAGGAQGGWQTAGRLSDCFLVPSTGGHFLFTTTGTTDGNTKCDVTWNKTYAGL